MRFNKQGISFTRTRKNEKSNVGIRFCQEWVRSVSEKSAIKWSTLINKEEEARLMYQYIKDCEAGAGRTLSVRRRK